MDATTGTRAFQLACQRSEVIRTRLVIGLLLFFGGFTLVRYFVTGMQRDELFMVVQGWAVIGACLVFEFLMLRMVRKAIASERILPPSAWVASVVVECMIPTVLMLAMANSANSPFDPYQSLTLPVVLLFALFILLSILRLSPWLASLSGFVSAGGYGIALGVVLARFPIGEHAPIALPLAMYVTYGVALLVIGLSAALVSREIRSHVWAALREADTRRQMEILHRDLDIARSIQQGLLPDSAPKIQGYDIAGWNRPADQTGGDYFDWQLTSEGRLAVTLADVSGHGIGPALVTAVCRAYARASLPSGQSLGAMLDLINDLLVEDLPDDRFITFVLALLDPKSHHADVLSAGHGPILVYHAESGKVHAFGAHGIPFGVVSQFGYGPEQRVALGPGDLILLTTDGFFEWANPDRAQWGTARLSESLARHAKGSGEEIIKGVLADVEAFARGTAQNDDLTAVVIKRKA